MLQSPEPMDRTRSGDREMPTHRLERTTLTTSRLLDFCSEKELVAQTGHDVEDWPLVVLKELVDNALDACEEAGVAPEIAVTVGSGGIEVADNGPGIPESTIEGVLDFSSRVSSREAYVAPDRGAQGNALKTIAAIPFVLDGREGLTQITAQGVRMGEVERLLCAMRAESKPVKPAALGVIGREHLEQRFVESGCEMKSFDYRRIAGEGADGLPYVVETAFGWCQGLSRRRLIAGVNWSPGIVNPFRQLGEYGRSLDGILAQQRAGPDEPIALLVHCVHPRVEYTDRGKSAVVVRG